jgi:NAD(P)-dependent dehydrogenase (short-subunit alcohol dehydrogenase family)
MPANGFDAEVVVITGASAGVGRATVRAFARGRAHWTSRTWEGGLEGARAEVPTCHR